MLLNEAVGGGFAYVLPPLLPGPQRRRCLLRRQRRRPTIIRPRRGWTTRLTNDHPLRATHPTAL